MDWQSVFVLWRQYWQQASKLRVRNNRNSVSKIHNNWLPLWLSQLTHSLIVKGSLYCTSQQLFLHETQRKNHSLLWQPSVTQGTEFISANGPNIEHGIQGEYECSFRRYFTGYIVLPLVGTHARTSLAKCAVELLTGQPFRTTSIISVFLKSLQDR